MLLGFWTTYFRPIILHRFDDTVLTHAHGVLFLSWPVLFLTQALLAYRRKFAWHRAVGKAGGVLAVLMVLSGIAIMSQSLHNWARQGLEEGGRNALLITSAGLAMFAIFVTAAFLNLRRSDYHKRFMYLATVAMMQGASGRIGFMIATGGNPNMLRLGLSPPPSPLGPLAPHLALALVLIGALALYDWRSLGRLHRVTWGGGGLLLLVLATRHLLAGTQIWHWVTDLILAV
jgi:hypothetical protein